MVYILFDYTGKYGPLFMLIFSLYLLSNKPNLQYYYLIGLVINTILNLVLKGIIKQPRPFDDEKNFNLAIKNIPDTIYKDGVPFNIFGMPSGHAQIALYSTVFIYLSLKKGSILLLYLLVSLIIIAQRIIKGYHTYFQILVGCLVGSIMGYIFYSLANNVIRGRIREKIDDFGPL